MYYNKKNKTKQNLKAFLFALPCVVNRKEESGTHDLGLAQVLVAHRHRLQLQLKPAPEGASSE